jgi:16S rRNA (uracil1498-N3)-methyltransferase
MNSLIIYEDEGWHQGCIRLVGERARAARGSGTCLVGAELRVALLGGDKGLVRVCVSSDERVVLELLSTERSLSLRPIDLIVGLSRPQTTKKVIQAAVMSGVRSLHLVHLESGEKSYLDAHIFREADLRDEIVKALEQTWEGLYPAISVHRNFASFTRSHASLFGAADSALRVVAHPGAAPLSNVGYHATQSVVIAVGSEGGWSEQELQALLSRGFIQIGLGRRIVRVEVALLYLLGQTLGIGVS